MKEFKEFLKKKLASSKPMKDPSLMEARQSALGGLKEDMASRMSDKLGGLKKVTVAAPSEEGLKKGLEVAEDVVGEDDSEDGLMEQALSGKADGVEDAGLPSDEEMDDEEKDPEDMSLEELEMHISRLEELKALKAGG